jgi:hypothetical protein
MPTHQYLAWPGFGDIYVDKDEIFQPARQFRNHGLHYVALFSYFEQYPINPIANCFRLRTDNSAF